MVGIPGEYVKREGLTAIGYWLMLGGWAVGRLGGSTNTHTRLTPYSLSLDPSLTRTRHRSLGT